MKQSIKPLLAQYAQSKIRSAAFRRIGSVSASPDALQGTHGCLAILSEERKERRRIALELEKMGHPVHVIKLSSAAHWANSTCLPTTPPEATWHIEGGRIVVLSTRRSATMMEEFLASLTRQPVLVEDMPIFQVTSLESTETAMDWIEKYTDTSLSAHY